MKKFSKLPGIIAIAVVIGFSLTACGTFTPAGIPSQDTFTLTGIPPQDTFTLTGIPPQYNGNYAFLLAESDNEFLLGAQAFSIEAETATLPVISNGRVSIPVWMLNDDETDIIRYSGSHTFEVEVLISKVQTFSETFDDSDFLAAIYFESVAFSNGSAARSWNEGEADTDF